MPEPVVVVSPFSLPADSPAVETYAAWRRAGGTIRELMEKALTLYGSTAEYQLRLKQLKKGD